MPSRNRRTDTPWVPGDLTGKVVLVTGANGGIGYWTALALARAGARVLMACRSLPKADQAYADIKAEVPDAQLEIIPLDLADLASVRKAADDVLARTDRLDVLVNNAGVALVANARTTDGFESHLGANFLGHFALTGHLIDLLLATPGSRVVHVGSLAHRTGRLRYENLAFETGRRYHPWTAYAQSKLANTTFMLELERRLRLTDASTVSVGGHPGASFTGIADRMWIIRVPGIRPIALWLEGKALNVPELGADPSVRAATEPGIAGGTYYGPSGFGEVNGAAGPARISPRAHVDGSRLWEAASRLTGVHFLD